MPDDRPVLTGLRRLANRVGQLGLLSALVALAPARPVDSPVSDAAMRADWPEVRRLLRQGADVNAPQGDGMTALHWAGQQNDGEHARMLIQAGARLDAATRNGAYTALHVAARVGAARAVTVLLAAGADPNAATSSGGASALHFAAAHGNRDVVLALLDRGARVDARDSAWGQTPLMWAAASDRVAAIDALLSRGADLKAVSRVEDIPARGKADRAALQARTRRMAALKPPPARDSAKADSAKTTTRPDSVKTADSAKAKTATPDSAAKKPDSMRAALSKAAADSLKAAEKGLSYGELVGHRGGLTPLLFATRQGHVGSVTALLAAGADINQVSAGDKTSPLLMAVINGHFDLAALLLERGADPRLASDAGATPLYGVINLQWAAKSLYPQPTAHHRQTIGYLALMEALLKKGADPNVRLRKHLWYMSYNFDLLGVNTGGATPFWRAAYGTDVEAMRLLMKFGADPTIPTLKPAGRQRGDDAVPGDSATKGKDPSGLPPIPVGGPGVYPIHAASGVGYGEGFAANSHRHVPDGWLPAVKYLVEELGADVNARDHNGYNPVHHAAARGDNALIEYLVGKGADVGAVSRQGQTTADMANGPVQRVPPFLETVARLEKLGSKNNHKCKSC
jgi:ankyrin repeat protein